MKEAQTVVLTGTGYGGHLTPALAVAAELRSLAPNIRVLYAAAEVARKVPRLRQRWLGAVRVFPLWEGAAGPSGAFFRLQLLTTGLRETYEFLKAVRPAAVMGCGGYGALPVVLAAILRRIPVLIHEQNVELGLANRFLSRWVTVTAVSFPPRRASRTGPRSGDMGRRVLFTGMPLPPVERMEKQSARTRMGLDPSRCCILVLGGSLGSRSLNRIVHDAFLSLGDKLASRLQVIHQTGPGMEPDPSLLYSRLKIFHRVFDFSSQLSVCMQAADFAVARAGGSTLAELRALGLPAILIPYPYANSHQMANAEAASDEGWAEVIPEGKEAPGKLTRVVEFLMDHPEELERRRNSARVASDRGVAARVLAEEVLKLVNHE
jgi:UDP-N-acetylglucosamine--N-acetylmuramyl-(pentapeptide) pyrophosphoryl-undecaprenol N-acetylglucosamine transferase